MDIDWSWTNAIYEYNRCVLNLGQGYTYPAISEMTFCWDLWVGTSLTAGKASMETNQITDKMKLDSASKLQVESDRSAVVNSVK